MTTEPNDLGPFQPPSWLSKAEKKQFLALFSRENVGKQPISALDIDAIGDYVAARTRIRQLRELVSKEMREEYPSTSRIIALSRQIDATTALSRRIGSKLGLADVEPKS